VPDGKLGEAKFVEDAYNRGSFSGDVKNVFPNLDSDFGGAVVDGNIDTEQAAL
jgi:hypothetical protein